MKIDAFLQHACAFLLPLACAQATPLLDPTARPGEAPVANPLTRQFQDSYTQALQAAFARIAQPREKSGRGQKRRADSLALVDHDELERQLLIEQHGRNLQPQVLEPLQYLSLRLERLAGQGFEIPENPLHPQQLGLYMQAACMAVSKDTAAITDVLERWLATADQDYARWISAWNDWLISQGVLPWLDRDSIEERYLRREAELAAARQTRKETLSRITGKPLGDDEALPSAPEIMEQLGWLIRRASAEDAGLQAHVPVSLPGAAPASHADILEALRRIDSLDLARLPRHAGSGYAEAETSTPLSRLLADSPALQDKTLDEATQSTVALLSMVFERFQADQAIAGPVRALMGALQVPMLQSALADADFLVDADNPAQQLLNEIGKLGMQWSGKPNAAQDALYTKLESVVADIQQRAHEGQDAFEDNLQELQYFVAAEERKAALINERALAGEHARARLANANRESQRAIASRINHLQLPGCTADFIQDSWQRVLFFLYNRDPDAHQESTRESLTLLDELLAAAQGQGHPDVDQLIARLDRHMILAGREEPIPKLKLAALNRELKAIAAQQAAAEAPAPSAASTAAASPSAPPPDSAPAAAEATPAPAPAPEPETAAAALAEALPLPELPELPELPADAPVTLVEVNLPDPEPEDDSAEDDFDRVAAALTPNSWFIYLPDDTRTVKVKLAAVIKYNQTYVFINRDGAKVLSAQRPEVADKLRQRQLQLIESGAVFERTLAHIITAMRQ